MWHQSWSFRRLGAVENRRAGQDELSPLQWRVPQSLLGSRTPGKSTEFWLFTLKKTKQKNPTFLSIKCDARVLTQHSSRFSPTPFLSVKTLPSTHLRFCFSLLISEFWHDWILWLKEPRNGTDLFGPFWVAFKHLRIIEAEFEYSYFVFWTTDDFNDRCTASCCAFLLNKTPSILFNLIHCWQLSLYRLLE